MPSSQGICFSSLILVVLLVCINCYDNSSHEPSVPVSVCLDFGVLLYVELFFEQDSTELMGFKDIVFDGNSCSVLVKSLTIFVNV